MQRVDKGRGAKCEMLPATKESCEEVVRKLERLKLWANYFDVETHLATIINWVRQGPHSEALDLTTK
jgi:hypothetical protein